MRRTSKSAARMEKQGGRWEEEGGGGEGKGGRRRRGGSKEDLLWGLVMGKEVLHERSVVRNRFVLWYTKEHLYILHVHHCIRDNRFDYRISRSARSSACKFVSPLEPRLVKRARRFHACLLARSILHFWERGIWQVLLINRFYCVRTKKAELPWHRCASRNVCSYRHVLLQREFDDSTEEDMVNGYPLP